jgi:F0F1-type ATP synthase assembly protein I
VSSASPRPQVERVTEPKQADRSLGELFADLGRDLSSLVRDEMELARTEMRQEVQRAKQAGVSFGAAAVAGLLTLMFLSAALAWLLDQWLNTALSFFIVGLLWAVIAAIAVAAGRKQAERIEPIPKTVETLKEDVEWAKQQKS